jgi:lipopolysaccharide transport system ATP-binding protein
MLIGPAMRTLNPDQLHFHEREAASFQVVDCPAGNTARGDYPGGIPGAVRPLLRWTTEYEPAASMRDGVPAA